MKVYDIITEDTLNEKGEIGRVVAKGFNAAKSAVTGAAKTPKKGLAPTTQAAKDYKAARAANAEKFSTKGLKGVDKFDQLKQLADANKAARAAAVAKVNNFPDKVLTALQIGLGLEAVYSYHQRLAYLEDQWKAFLSGDKNTDIFSDLDVNNENQRALAQERANQMRERLLGELTIIVGTAVAGATVAKGMQMFGGIVKGLGGAVYGPIGALPGAGIQKLTSLAAKLGKTGSVGFMAFLKTPLGMDFLNNGLVTFATGLVGSAVAKLIDEGIKALEAMGIDVPDALKSPIAATKADNIGAVNDPNDRRVYIGPYDYPVTDHAGKLLPGIENDRMVQAIRAQAKAAGQPDPLAGIKR